MTHKNGEEGKTLFYFLISIIDRQTFEFSY